jgi:hypothetical protein
LLKIGIAAEEKVLVSQHGETAGTAGAIAERYLRGLEILANNTFTRGGLLDLGNNR